MTNVVQNYMLANDFRRIFRLTRPCFEEFCNILSTRPEMQVRPSLMGGRERTVLIALRYFGHQGKIRTIS